jgi:hypothetical protein
VDGETTGGRVIVAARLNQLDLETRVGKRAAEQKLVDRGDDVVWRDRDGERTFTLPGRAEAGGEQIASVVKATFRVLAPGASTSSETTLLFLAAADGRCLVRIAQASMDLTDLYDDHNLQRIWPREVFAELEARGVDYREVQLASPDECEATYPGSVPTTLKAMGPKAWNWTAVALAVLIVGVTVYALLSSRG